MPRTRRALLLVAPLLAVAVVASIAVQHIVRAHSVEPPRLRSFDSCGELHEHYLEITKNLYVDEVLDAERDEVEAEEEAEEAEEVAVDDSFVEDSAATTEAAEDVQANESVSDGGVVSETGTNVQERGVDESDIIKTDGEYFYVLRPQSLLIAEVSEAGPLVEVGRITFADYSYRQELLITDDRAVVVRLLDPITQEIPFDEDNGPFPNEPFSYSRDQSEVLEIDISRAESPRLLRDLNLDGSFLTGRLVGDDLRVALQHHSPAPWPSLWRYWRHWDWSDGQWHSSEEYAQALERNFKLGNWFPLYSQQDVIAGTFTYGHAIGCGNVFASEDPLPTRWNPRVSSAYMLSFDLSEGTGDWASVAVLGTVEQPTVYGSLDSVYLGAPHGNGSDTVIHRFDVAEPLEPTYFGAGLVHGRLLSQWSLSEHNGYLRVATTEWDRWPTVSSVSVFRAVADSSDDDARPTGRLEQVGLVSNLGRSESIFAVRFAGDVGYVVTFRQVDPLYVLDLSDPMDPQEVGELKIPGFSRYLHPLSGGLLFGVGRDADPQTGRERGLQATLFDVSDPAKPTQLSVLPLGADAFSPVEDDHRAFRYHDGIAWIPVGPQDWRFRNDHDGAFFGVAVSSEGLSHEATLRVQGPARRAVPVGDLIFLLSDQEIRTYDLQDNQRPGNAQLCIGVGPSLAAGSA